MRVSEPLRGWAMIALIPAALATSSHAQQCSMEWISVSPAGTGGNDFSSRPSISANGRWVAFGSESDNLVAGDANFDADVFVRDRAVGTTTLISRPTGSGQANGWSGLPAISADGRFVAFRSVSTNLDPADADPKPDIYRHDLASGETVLVSYRILPGTHPEGAWQTSISQDGRYVAFDCWDDNLVPGDQNGTIDVYMRDMQSGVTELISVGNQGQIGDDVSDTPSISWDGRYVAFASRAGNWFPGNDQHFAHVYVRDRVLGTTALVSYAPSGTYGPVGAGWTPSISGDGTKVAFAYFGGDIAPSLFAHSWRGQQVFLRDLTSGKLTYVGYSIGGGLSSHTCAYPSLSFDGRYVTWESYSEDLTVTPGSVNQDVYLRDMDLGVTALVSQGIAGAQPSSFSLDPSISADGRTIAFASQANNLVAGDSGFIIDIFVRECDVASPTIYCSAKTGASGCTPKISSSGSPSASAGSGFLVCGDSLVGGVPAMVVYASRPAYSHALGIGVLCLQPPLVRTPALASGGTPGACDGAIDFDMNAWIASGVDPSLVAGETAYAQIWGRDPVDPFGGVLSEAVAFLIEP